ncbi:hypothetical protein N7495_007227 [Penicillium taxi]|uniref:uncharacterized protein n=1 Tax=Penicillium taxi TaxID=168475 RepID=UPI00254548A9|nr:uncharacterized protein N7495_007227 [Penicillium taxi]KAJ5895536.1 hypothetical protein N7495_007227 [Penicillium taxi]
MQTEKDLPSETGHSVSANSFEITELATPKHRHLYFAYGSNLSPSQMKLRCKHNPTLSSTPLAIAFLPSWKWLICQAGYANVVPPPGMRVGKQDSAAAHKIPASGTDDGVYGLLYEMDPADERLLDMYEGVDHDAKKADRSEVPVDIRPLEQGKGSYNKWYLHAQVVEWIGDGEHPIKTEKNGEALVLVYVDENRVVMGPPKTEYIGRMNRAIRESVSLGIPGRWIEDVMRRFIPVE